MQQRGGAREQEREREREREKDRERERERIPEQKFYQAMERLKQQREPEESLFRDYSERFYGNQPYRHRDDRLIQALYDMLTDNSQ